MSWRQFGNWLKDAVAGNASQGAGLSPKGWILFSPVCTLDGGGPETKCQEITANLHCAFAARPQSYFEILVYCTKACGVSLGQVPSRVTTNAVAGPLRWRLEQGKAYGGSREVSLAIGFSFQNPCLQF